eukprot:TRINITY_DN7038_c0_g1_i1.p1 TRINITY_DN7038_c0_g1~~TRINITY_DN7038_c0_g1_i1.p1  ORF type:complete len:586 (+),score=79.18 TRINITY_DN7038_c0_g1_i1:87-1844(+)
MFSEIIACFGRDDAVQVHRPDGYHYGCYSSATSLLTHASALAQLEALGYDEQMREAPVTTIGKGKLKVSVPAVAFAPATDGGSPPCGMMGAVGLKRLGDKSWMNAALQCLSHIPKFAEFFVGPGGLAPPTGHPNVPSRGELCRAVSMLQQFVWRGGDALGDAANRDVANLHKTITDLAAAKLSSAKRLEFQKNNVSVLVSFCLEQLHRELNNSVVPEADTNCVESPLGKAEAGRRGGRGRLDGSRQSFSSTARTQRRHALRQRLEGLRRVEVGTSFIADEFQGQLHSQVTCSRCGCETLSVESFFTLTVPVTDGDWKPARLLGQLDTAFPAVSSRWSCPECRQTTDALKQTRCVRMPNTLALHFDRANSDAHAANTNTSVSDLLFPLKADMGHGQGNHVIDVRDVLYDVVGVVVPTGDDKYVAKCPVHIPGTDRSCERTEWYVFGDEVVRPLQEGEEVLSSDATMVFLSRRQRCESERAPALTAKDMSRQSSLMSPARRCLQDRALQSKAFQKSPQRYSCLSEASTDWTPSSETFDDEDAFGTMDGDGDSSGSEEFNIWGRSDRESLLQLHADDLHPALKQFLPY